MFSSIETETLHEASEWRSQVMACRARIALLSIVICHMLSAPNCTFTCNIFKHQA